MGAKWPMKRLSELAEFRNGVNYNKSSFGVGVKVVGVSDFQDYTRPRYAELKQINPEGIVTERNILRDGDIVFVRSNGNRELIGRSLHIENPPEEVTHSAFTIRLRFCAKDCFSKFFAYCFRTPVIRQALTAYGGGTNISNLNQDILNALSVPFPPLPTQRKIAGILSAYDDLIENSLRRIRILEEMAQNLYREWFVKFCFPGHAEYPPPVGEGKGEGPYRLVDSPLGKMPEGWEVATLGDLAAQVRRSVRSDEVDPDTPCFGLEHLPRKSITLADWGLAHDVQSTKLAFNRGDILFGKIRPYFHKVGVAPVDGLCSSDAIVIVPKDARFFSLVLECVSSEEFVDHATRTSQGTKMPRANWDVLAEYPVPVPTQPILGHFNTFVRDTVSQLLNLLFRNRTLRCTRDLLLPRLISGELDVSELDIQIPCGDWDAVPHEPDEAEAAPTMALGEGKPDEGHGSTDILADEKVGEQGIEERPSGRTAPIPIEAFETDEVMAAFRQAARGRGVTDRDELIKEASVVLGYERLGSRVEEALRGHLRAAIRRKIIGANGLEVSIEAPAMADYDREVLIDTLVSVMRKNREYEREDVYRAVANHLGFRRLTDTVRTPIKCAIYGAIRQGVLDYQGDLLWRQ